MLLTCLLPFLATKGSRVLEEKVNETELSKTVFSHLRAGSHFDISISISTSISISMRKWKKFHSLCLCLYLCNPGSHMFFLLFLCVCLCLCLCQSVNQPLTRRIHYNASDTSHLILYLVDERITN